MRLLHVLYLAIQNPCNWNNIVCVSPIFAFQSSVVTKFPDAEVEEAHINFASSDSFLFSKLHAQRRSSKTWPLFAAEDIA